MRAHPYNLDTRTVTSTRLSNARTDCSKKRGENASRAPAHSKNMSPYGKRRRGRSLVDVRRRQTTQNCQRPKGWNGMRRAAQETETECLQIFELTTQSGCSAPLISCMKCVQSMCLPTSFNMRARTHSPARTHAPGPVFGHTYVRTRRGRFDSELRAPRLMGPIPNVSESLGL